MSILVIGGNGFIGSHVVDLLLAGGYAVKVLDRTPERFRPPLEGVVQIQGDFADRVLVAEALAGVDAVVHLASTTVPATSNLSPTDDIIGNLVGTVSLLETMRATGVRRIVYLSSGGTVYGIPETDPVAEDHPLRPISSYGIVKVAVENYLAMERFLHGLDYVAVRPSNPYGPRQGHLGVQGLIGTYLWRVVRGEPLQVWGDGSICRDYIHVRDVARFCVLALTSGVSGVFNAGSGKGLSVAEVGRLVAEVTGRDLQIEHLPARPFDVPRVVLDTSAAAKALGWRPEIGIVEGLAETWAWVQAQAADGATPYRGRR